MTNILIVAALFLGTTNLLSAQSMASLYDVRQAELQLSNTVRSLEQNILLALTAGVVLLMVLFLVYVIHECTQFNRSQQGKGNHFLSLIVLVVGTSMFCSSCGVPQQVQATTVGTPQELIQRGCPHPHANLEPLAFGNIYRSIGYPEQRTTTCKFCGQRLVNPRD